MNSANHHFVFNPVEQLRHPNERSYFVASAIVGGLLWAVLLLSTFGLILIYALIGVLISVLASLWYRAEVFGNHVAVSERQLPEVFQQLEDASRALGILSPTAFIIPGNGVLNAFALKILSGRYVILHSELIDFALMRGSDKELRFIILHELAHHAAGHTSTWKNILLLPSKFVPFLGAAYSRSCEYTCDAIAAYMNENEDSSLKALLMLGHGSRALADRVNVEAFTSQDVMVPTFMGFVREVLSSHPRLTLRVSQVKRLEAKRSHALQAVYGL